MNPRRFLFTASCILLTTSVLGMTGHLGRISRAAFFHPPYWINWVHLSLGTLAVSVAARGTRKSQAEMAFVPAVLATTLGLSGLLLGSRAAKRFNIPELADPSEHTAHLLVGLLALWGWLGRKAGIE
jgi:hypothetical protein